jgi:hypothetical protein
MGRQKALTMATVFDQYLADNNLSLSAFAESIGRHHWSLARSLIGERNMSMNFAYDCERGTRGKIKAHEFIALCFEAKRRRKRKNKAA